MEKQGLSPADLVKKMKGNPKTVGPDIYRLFNGKIAFPSLERYHAIANALGVKIEEILGKDYWKHY